MSETPNHGYNVPNRGVQDWNVPLNENFQQYDTDIEIRDTESNRGNYEPKAGAKFLATDTERVYVGDGSNWQRMESTGTDSTLSSLEVSNRLTANAAEAASIRTSTLQLTSGSSNTLQISASDDTVVSAASQSTSDTAVALQGEVAGSSGKSEGVRGVSRSSEGIGVNGINWANSGSVIGVSGKAPNSPGGIGVLGTGSRYGVRSVGDARVDGKLETAGAVDASADLSVSNSSGSNSIQLSPTDTDAVAVTTDSSDNVASAVRAEASSNSGNTFGVYAVNRSTGGTGVFGVNFAGSGNTVGVVGDADTSPDGIGVHGAGGKYGVYSDGDARVDGSLQVDADLNVSGNKNFVQAVETADGPKEVAYTASEAPTARTEVSGVARLDDGRTRIDLPEHFGWVTSDDEPLHVQTTPYSVDSAGLAVVERTTEGLVVADRDGEGDYEFAYTVTGTRAGHEDKQVVREPGESAAVDPGADVPGTRTETASLRKQRTPTDTSG